MIRARQRRLSCMLMLVLALELALLCCASVHLTEHACGDHGRCAICSFVRTGLRRVAIAFMMASALPAAFALYSGAYVSRRFITADSPVLRRVRLND